MILFSIIIPTFNSAQIVPECLESILNQSFKAFEILIIDGGSTDNTLEIIKNFDDERIKILSEPDNGIYDAMNKGIKMAKGEWLYFIGSDDTLYDKEVLETVHEKINNNKVDVIYGNVLMMQSGVINDGEFDFVKIQTDPICHQAIFYNKSVFISFGSYNLKYNVFADADFNLKWFFSDKHKHLYIDRIIAKYAETGYSAIQKDPNFYNDLPEKLVILGRKKIGLIKLKEHATYAALNNKKAGNIVKYIHFKTIYFYFRCIDIKRRMFHS